jgi:aryl-alcohol dehydrogenase-like predicted oxidoreductase
MMPLCLDQHIGVIPWSPLARGLLAGKRRPKTVRATTDTYGKQIYGEEISGADARVVDRVEELALESGVAPAQLALAWLLHKPGVVAPIVGASKAEHIADAVSALDVKLDSETIAKLEELYLPHAVAGIT